MNEQTLKLMSILGITEEEAKAVIEDDKKVDQMTKMSEVNADLTEEQKKASKQARQADRKKDTPTTKKKVTRKPDEYKRQIIQVLANALTDADIKIEVENPERIIKIFGTDTKYKITLSKITKE